MDYKRIKNQANQILKNKSIECDYIEYKKTDSFLDKILKTICAYANNYYENDTQYLFIGVDEENTNETKAIPKLPINGIDKEKIELVENNIKSLRPFLYPNVDFEVLRNNFEGKDYVLVVVEKQSNGPYQTNEKGEKKLKVKPARYIRVEAITRKAMVDEEYDLIRKFANYHFTSQVNRYASIDDLNLDCINEYISIVSDRDVYKGLNKVDILSSLGVLDKNYPTKTRIKNFGILMFSYDIKKYIPYGRVDVIVDSFGTKRKMESKTFNGPIWKQYYSVLNYINDNYINTITIRDDGVATNRKVTNFPYVALEELIANALVHNDYENDNPIQIYVSDKEITIINYNRPLPPLKIKDLNERTVFKTRKTENPEIREMFKELGIIEDYGTGIGEAKRAMELNGSPKLYYTSFDEDSNVTSVTIPVNKEYYSIKYDDNLEEVIKNETRSYKELINNSKYSENVKHNLVKILDSVKDSVFSNKTITGLLNISQNSATRYINKLKDELQIIEEVRGAGHGKYKINQ